MRRGCVIVTMDEKDVDRVVLRAVAERIGKDRFDVWFNNQIEVQWRGNRLEIAAPSRFYADRLAAMFGGEISRALSQVAGGASTVVYSVVENSSPPVAAASRVAEQRPAEAARLDDARADPARPKKRFKTLDSFVVGSTNRMAFTGARTTIEHPGDFSPLLLWGPPGTGKTHLLEAIWVELRRRHADRMHVLYVTAEQFTTMFLAALHGRGLPSFRQKFRTVDVLLIDDIQFFSQKKATLVELQHTVDVLNRNGKQLVMTADRSPADLGGLGNELMTRVAGGLACGLQLPDLETRRQIVARVLDEVAARMPAHSPPGGTGLPDALRERIAASIAEQVPGDARQLRGAVNQVVATARAQKRPLSRTLVQEALSGIAAQVRQHVALEDIEKAVCDVFGLKPHALQSDKRSKNISQPRMLAMWLARKHTPAVYAEIGDYFGRRSHSTVIAAQKKVRQWLESESTVNLAGSDCRVTEALQQVEARLRLA